VFGGRAVVEAGDDVVDRRVDNDFRALVPVEISAVWRLFGL